MPDIAPLAAELRFALNRLHRRLRYQQVGDDLTISQLSVLSLLQQQGPLSAGDLAGREHVRPPSMTRIIAALDGMGLVTRRGHPSDGRQVVVALTAAGEQRAAAETAARDKWLAQQLARHTTLEQRNRIREVVKLLNELADG